MQPHSPQSMSLFFLFIAIILVPDSTPVYAQIDMNCSQKFKCGNIPDIGYPFWGSNRPQYCGHPEFELNCTGQTAVITVEELTYQVLEINSEEKTLKVARTDYIDNICPSNPVSTTLNFNYFSYTSDIQIITLYYGCPQSNPMPTLQDFTNQFSCNDSNGFFVTRNLSNLTAALMTYFRTCDVEVIVPANQSAVQSLENRPNQENLVIALEQGFGLEWRENSTCETCNMSGGQCGSNSTDPSLFACYCTNGPDPFSCGRSQSSGKKPNIRLILGIGLGAAAAVLTICLGIYYCFTRRVRFLSDTRWKNVKKDEKIENFILNYQSFMPKRYSYSDIQRMTNSFNHKLGQGGFGGVYKGKLLDGRVVAVKVLSKSTGDGEEFINEVASISRTSHINVVTLLGFCYERSKRALIYEYMPNGSLDKFIYDQGSQGVNKHLDWKTLYDITVGIARGLEYLHRGCNTRIVHFDIKPHNILLDKDFCPKVSDFGLAKLCKGKESIITMLGARGTIGYIAPEIFIRNFGGVSYKSDVYSYGMMILEICGGRNKSDVGVSHSGEVYFPECIYKYIESEQVSTLHEKITDEEGEMVRRLTIVGLWCIQTNPSDRPSMTKVVEMLEGSSLESLQIPPKPSLFAPTTPQHYSSTLSSAPVTKG
eukprot:XP_015573229.2 LEAF RUST 10 DISEASE-RESISTANCE LOCUS RECEPTOR-LIKE PROTEIN KINASE-like 2.1 [Ricinus communis]